MPTWKNTLEAKKESVTFIVALSFAHHLGYTYLKYKDEIFAIVDNNTAILTPYTLE